MTKPKQTVLTVRVPHAGGRTRFLEEVEAKLRHIGFQFKPGEYRVTVERIKDPA